MIRVTKFDGKVVMLNADWIQTVEATPDTLITLTTGFTLLVKEGVEQIVRAFTEYKKVQHTPPTIRTIESEFV